MTKTATLTLGEHSYEIAAFTGAVLENQQRSDVQISGGGSVTHGSGSTSISSTTTHHQKLFLRDGERGKEREVNSVNWDLSCRPGHVLSLLMVSRAGEPKGVYTHVYNHDTENLMVSLGQLPDVILGPRKLFWMLIGASVVIGFLSSWFLAALGFIGTVWYYFRAKKTYRRKLLASPAFEAVLKDMQAEDPESHRLPVPGAA